MWYFPIQNTLLSDCLSFFISWTKSFGAVSNNRNLVKANPVRSSFFFDKIKLKMGDYPGSGYKMSSYGLKVYNPQETAGQWTQCCKVYYITHARRSKLQFMKFVLLVVSLTKLPVYVSARRGDQEKPYCHNRRRRCSWYMESGDTKVFRSTSRHQLFSGQDHGMFELSLMPCLSERILMCLDDDLISRLLVNRDVCRKNFIQMKVVCIAVSCFRHIGFIQ